MTKLFSEFANDTSKLFLVGKADDGSIVAFHWLQIETKYDALAGHICSLWVDERFRREGIGLELQSRGEAWAKSQGAKFVDTDVFYANKKMIADNEKLGFESGQVEVIKSSERASNRDRFWIEFRHLSFRYRSRSFTLGIALKTQAGSAL